MSEPKPSLDAIIDDFVALQTEQPDPSNRKAITIWVTPEYKEKYDRVQKRSGRQFWNKLQQVVYAAIDRCEPSEAA